MSETEVGIFIAFTAGIFSFLSPCVLPLVPSYLTLVTGMSLEDLEAGVNRKATFIHSLLFVLGFSVIFILLGASASFLGQFFRQYEIWIARVGGLVIIILGLHLSGVFKLTPLMREKRMHFNNKPAGYIGTFGVGMAFGAGWTPCIGPILGAILTYGFSQDTMWAGVGLLTVYSVPDRVSRSRLVPTGLQEVPPLDSGGGKGLRDHARGAGHPPAYGKVHRPNGRSRALYA